MSQYDNDPNTQDTQNKQDTEPTTSSGPYQQTDADYDYMDDPNTPNRATWVEELQVKGRDTVSRVKELLQEGNVRRVIVRRKNGEILMEFPLTAGVVGGSAMLVFAPMFATLAAVVAFLAEVRIEVIREMDLDDTEHIPGKDQNAEQPKSKPQTQNKKKNDDVKKRIEID
jgi:hypothetical protein